MQMWIFSSIYRIVYFPKFNLPGQLNLCLSCRASTSGEAVFFITSVTLWEALPKFWENKCADSVSLSALFTIYKLTLLCEFSPVISFFSFSVCFLQSYTNNSLVLVVLWVEFIIQDINAVINPIFNPPLADLRLALCSCISLSFPVWTRW